MKEHKLIAMANNSPQSPPSKGSRKMLIAAIVIVILVVAVVGAYVALNTGSSNNNPTPAPSATATPVPGATATPVPATTSTPSPVTSSPSQTNAVGTASSLQISMDFSSAGTSQGTYTYRAKNIGTANEMIRAEVTDTQGNQTIFIINGAQHKAWGYSDGEWQDSSSAYDLMWNTWSASFTQATQNIVGWGGVGDYTYTAPNGDSVRYYNIAVNPTLEDSLFVGPS